MRPNLDLHDASIDSVAYSQLRNVLTLGITLPDSRKCAIEFLDVFGWDFSPFAYQNYLFNFLIHDSESLTEATIENYEVEKKYVTIIRDRKGLLFELDPASGMGGYVVAVAMDVKFEPRR